MSDKNCNGFITIKDRIADIIYKELSSSYCWNCRYDSEVDNEDACENCIRKCMRWAISMGTATGLAEDIIDLI